jgi:hypothetical protein
MAKPAISDHEFVSQPFVGLPGEPGWVAMREILPAAVAKAKTNAKYGSQEVEIVTILPDGLVAMHRPDGKILLAIQAANASDDVSRDLGAALVAVLEAEPGAAVRPFASEPSAPRLQDVLDLSAPFAVEVKNDYEFWLDSSAERTREVEELLQHAADATVPMAEVAEVPFAFWTDMNAPFVRWVRPEDEDDVIKALARLQAKRAAGFAVPRGATKFLGMFRAAGLTVPVWQLPDGTTAEELAEPMQAFKSDFEAALADTSALNADERRARAGIISRQVTLR